MATATLSNLSPSVTTTTVAATPAYGAPVVATTSVPASMGVWAAIAGFILIFSFIWIILFSFRPAFVRFIAKGDTKPADDAPADPARCFVAALIIALLLVVIAWMFRACK